MHTPYIRFEKTFIPVYIIPEEMIASTVVKGGKNA